MIAADNARFGLNQSQILIMCVMICMMLIRELVAFLLIAEKRVIWVAHDSRREKREEKKKLAFMTAVVVWYCNFSMLFECSDVCGVNNENNNNKKSLFFEIDNWPTHMACSRSIDTSHCCVLF